MTTLEFLHLAADTHVLRQMADGSFPPGHNGTYGDVETPVRSTAHVLTLLSNLIVRGTPRQSWRRAAHHALDYLVSHETAAWGHTYPCRDAPGKDRCNGVVGQAFVIEALAAAAVALDSVSARERAEDLFRVHPWSPSTGLWQRVEPDGSLLSIDTTFNHQLWFAAAASQLTWVTEAQQRPRVFLDIVAPGIWLYRNGIVQHATPFAPLSTYLRGGWDQRVYAVRSRLSALKAHRALYRKSVGYHPFNLYAFALLKRSYPDSGFWSSARFAKMLDIAADTAIIEAQAVNDYSQCRELGGIKMAFVYETFTSDNVLVAETASRQIERSFVTSETSIATRDSVDSNTVLARLYELSRLKHEYPLELTKTATLA